MWRERIERQAASGLGVRAFCQREGFSDTNFHAWRRELRLRDRELVAVREQPRLVFVPAVITTEKPDDPAVLLTVALDGALHVNVSVERLADFAIALRQ
jgi:transposase-like protein